jgi:hypothetical protein
LAPLWAFLYGSKKEKKLNENTHFTGWSQPGRTGSDIVSLYYLTRGCINIADLVFYKEKEEK